MRGTDPTKSKWECPIMFYVCVQGTKLCLVLTNVSRKEIISITYYLFVCNSR
jgi:hypothetical protein